MFRASSKNHHERSAKPHNSHTFWVIGWNTIYLGFEWLVVPFVYVYDLGAQAAHRDTFFGQPAYWVGSQKDQIIVIIVLAWNR